MQANMPQSPISDKPTGKLGKFAEDFPTNETFFFVSLTPDSAVHYSHRLALFFVISTSLTVEHKNVFRRDCMAGHQSAILLVQVKVSALFSVSSAGQNVLTKISRQTHHQRTKLLPQ